MERLFNSGLVRTNLSFGHRFDIFTHPLYEHKLHCGYAINFILLEKGKKDGKRQKAKQKQKLDHKNCNQECINRMFKEKRALRSVRGQYLPMFSRKVNELQVYQVNCLGTHKPNTRGLLSSFPRSQACIVLLENARTPFCLHRRKCLHCY